MQKTSLAALLGLAALSAGADIRLDCDFPLEQELKTGARYALTVTARGPATGNLMTGTCDFNVDMNGLTEKWQTITNVFRAKSPGGETYRERFQFKGYNLTGEVTCRDIRLIEVKPEWAKTADGVELGPGESIEGNTYRFGPAFDAPCRNDSRPLVANRASFNTDRWCFGGHREAVYRHELAGRKLTSARLAATCTYYDHGEAYIEASGDGSKWLTLAKIDHSASYEATVPAEIFPTKALWIRFRGGDNCYLQIRSYSLDAEITGSALSAFGAVTYREANTAAKPVIAIEPPVLHRDDYGALLPGAAEGFALWTASSGWKVPRFRALPTATAKGLGLRTAANEAEAVQLVVTPTAACSDLRVNPVGDLQARGGRTIKSSAIDILRVGYVTVEMPTDAVGCRGLWPDPLPPQDKTPLAVKAGENQPFWIRVKPPKDTPAGVYRGKLAVVATAENGAMKAMEVPFAVEVFGFTLPDRMTVETAFGLDPRVINQYQGLKSDADRRLVAEKYLDELAAHHLCVYNPTPYVNPRLWWRGLEQNPLTAEPIFEWEAWDRAMEEAISKRHITTFRININGLGWGNFEQHGDPSLNGFKGGTPEYEAMMSKYLKAIESHLREKGWLDMAFVYWYDEPNPEDYPFVMNGFETLKKYAPGLRRMLTEEPHKGLLNGPNLWCPTTQNLHSDDEDQARKLGDTFWWYVCTSPKAPYITEFTDHAGSEMRLWLWQTWAENITGVLIWATTWWNSTNAYPDPEKPQNPYEDAMCWSVLASDKPGTKRPWGNGDGRFLYPPLAAASGRPTAPILEGPVGCCRLEMLRDGIEDYEYFAMLRRLIAERKDLSPETRAEFETLLTVPRTISTSLTSFNIDPAPIEAHRLKLARAIEALSKK